jgi:adenylate cyclase
MFTDIAGYTALTQTDEAVALRLLRRHNELLRPVFSRHRGREVKTIGDAFLVEFESALDATQCAVEVQRTLRDYNSSVADGPKIRVRIGIHLGDVVHAQGDVLGDAVNVASRIEPLAEPGGICISAQVYAQVENKLRLPFERLEAQALKNVRLPVDVYRVRFPEEEGTPSSTPSTKGRIAVLPFVNMSPDPSDEYFADGMTEELIGKLSEIPDLKVIARTSIMQYKRKEKRLADIGRELAVGSVVEGSVRRSGTRIRVAVQLVDARSEEHRWAATYDKQLDDIFAIQTDVASQVARALAYSLRTQVPPRDTVDVEAYTFYLQGMRLLHAETSTDRAEAVACFQRAIQRDPNFGRAYAGLARAWNLRVREGELEWSVVSEYAEPPARRALELAPASAESHATMSDVHGLLDRFPESIAEAEKAIEINPNLAEAHESLGRQKSSLGRLEEGREAYRRAYELDPLSVDPILNYAWVAQLAGKEEEAREVLESLDRRHPNDPRIYDGKAEFYALKGDLVTCERLLREALLRDPHEPTLRTDLATVLARTGRRAEAEEELRQAEIDAPTVYGKLLSVLYVRSALGDIEPAMEALFRLAEIHAWPYLIKVHPTFAALRTDPRFAVFLAKVGLPT